MNARTPSSVRLFLSAYACRPGRGSEPEVGFQTLAWASTRYAVTVVTQRGNVDDIRRGLTDLQCDEVSIIGLSLGPLDLLRRLGKVGLLLHYCIWQQRLSCLSGTDFDRNRFDVAHHVTFASHVLPIGVSRLGVPYVIGPVGGGARVRPSVALRLGPRGFAVEFGRAALGWFLTRFGVGRRALAGANHIFVQDRPTARDVKRLTDSRVELLSNAMVASIDVADLPSDAPSDTSSRILVVARLIPWKGVNFAIRSLAHLPGYELHIYGAGPDRRRLERLSKRLRVSERVHFRGHVPRSELIEAVQSGATVMHGSVRGNGLGVVEAIRLGANVVCVDRGDVDDLLAQVGGTPSVSAVPIDPIRTLPLRLARGVLESRSAHMPENTTDMSASDYFYRKLSEAYTAEA